MKGTQKIAFIHAVLVMLLNILPLCWLDLIDKLMDLIHDQEGSYMHVLRRLMRMQISLPNRDYRENLLTSNVTILLFYHLTWLWDYVFQSFSSMPPDHVLSLRFA